MLIDFQKRPLLSWCVTLASVAVLMWLMLIAIDRDPIPAATRWAAVGGLWLIIAGAMIRSVVMPYRKPDPLQLLHYGTNFDPAPRWRVTYKAGWSLAMGVFLIQVTWAAVDIASEPDRLADLTTKGYSRMQAEVLSRPDIFNSWPFLALLYVMLGLTSYRRWKVQRDGIDGFSDPFKGNWMR